MKKNSIEWNESQFDLSLEEWIVKVKEEDLNNLYSSLKRLRLIFYFTPHIETMIKSIL